MVVRKSDTRTPSKPPLKTSTYQLSHGNRLHKIVQSGEASFNGVIISSARVCTLHSPFVIVALPGLFSYFFLIKRGAGEYETKRISEAEQKRAQRKARAKASPTELSSSDLSCSICNRQFRAKTGLISHLRTHK